MNTPELTTTRKVTRPSQPSLLQDVVGLARYWTYAAWARIGKRRALILLGIALAGAGVALNWSWLAAIGVAPVLLSLAPCAAMCALGLCMNKMAGGNSCSKTQQPENTPSQIAAPKTESDQVSPERRKSCRSY